MNLTMLLLIIWLHFLADFIMQSDRVAQAKSTSNVALSEHVLTYQLPFLVMVPFVFESLMVGVAWVWINTLAHWVTDYFTSRLCSKLWGQGERHNFFVVIGFDQAIHLTTLITTYIMLS
jgi:hypothetical protein